MDFLWRLRLTNHLRCFFEGGGAGVGVGVGDKDISRSVYTNTKKH